MPLHVSDLNQSQKKPRAKATIFSTIYDTRLKRALQRFF